jgi:ABC-2 type transport system permease protein
MLLMPLIFAIVLPLAMVLPALISPGELDGNETQQLVSKLPGVEGMGAQEAYIVFMIKAMLPFFMILPAILPTIISSYSIIGEKKNRTLEPLLAAPVSVYDIIIGKALSALIPSLLATWISAVIYLCITSGLSITFLHRLILPDMVIWGLGMLVFAPLVAFLGIMLTVMISSRVNDPRVAQQISALLIIPIMALFIMQMSGLAIIDVRIMLALIVVAFIVDVISIRLGKFIFDREETLTRWK